MLDGIEEQVDVFDSVFDEHIREVFWNILFDPDYYKKKEEHDKKIEQQKLDKIIATMKVCPNCGKSPTIYKSTLYEGGGHRDVYNLSCNCGICISGTYITPEDTRKKWNEIVNNGL